MDGWLAGIAQVDYSPPLGLPLMGNFRDDYAARGRHDPLCGRAVVLQDPNGRRVALLSVDICMLDRGNVALMRRHVAACTDLAPEDILIAATHTHSAPAPMMLGCLPKAPDAEIEAFLTRAAEAVILARNDLRPASLRVGYSAESRLSFNRRLRCRDGRTRMNWERVDPGEVIEPLGPTDPVVVTLSIHRGDSPAAGLINFALHPAILAGDNWLYSADFPGYLGEALSGMISHEFVTFFFNGPCGNVNHIDYTDPQQGRGYQMTQRVGYMLAVAAYRAMRISRPVIGGELAVSREKVPLKRLSISDEQYQWAQEVIARLGTERSPGQVDGAPDEYYARCWLQMREQQSAGDAAEVMVMRIGDVGIVGLPGEVFCELGLELKKRSPARHTLVIELANDAIGYLPTREAFAQGGYEVSPGVTRYEPGAGQLLIDSAVRQLNRLFA